jgi:hypothetical protein
MVKRSNHIRVRILLLSAVNRLRIIIIVTIIFFIVIFLEELIT